ncbi:E3 ubiquitin-protein ligase RAD18 isoform X2 [Hypomesus transpacificus]|uniref:E3 ubiquitin-protein ligase RAD18 isoform X2 n=1 Tax=Hypomesus transpacificus TaxID=137520 RepID=UPI001F07F2FD|nr:E3 ubiquitin-protein ligase RAD18 isoform X2 [Hypomesus transpacificus]
MAYANKTDLPPNLPGLKNMDALLRCPICFEFLNIAMMTKCSHNFCSLCIRKFLSYKLQCPVCNSPTTEQDLRNNRILEDLVTNFHKARQELSDCNFDSVRPRDLAPKAPAPAFSCKSPRQPGPRDKVPRKGESIMRHFLQKKPSASTTTTSPLTETQQRHPEGRGTRPSASGHKHIQKDSDDSSQLLSVKEESIQEEIPVPMLVSVKEERTDVSVSEETTVDSPSTSQVVKVECPVCSVGISQHFINKHLDTCLTRGLKKESLRSSVGGDGDRRRPMAKLVYTLLSTQELKRRLKDCHLSATGPRPHLEQRLQEFVHIYNSQCDSLQPKSAEDIAKEVEAAEKIRNQLQRQTKRAMVFSKNPSEEEIDKLHSNYRQQHSSEFGDLIAEVRARMDTSGRRQQIKQEVEDGERGEPATEGRRARSPAGEVGVPDDDAGVSERAQETPSKLDPAGVTAGVTGVTAGSASPASPSYSDVSISRTAEQVGKRPCCSSGDDVLEQVGKRPCCSSGDYVLEQVGKRPCCSSGDDVLEQVGKRPCCSSGDDVLEQVGKRPCCSSGDDVLESLIPGKRPRRS